MLSIFVTRFLLMKVQGEIPNIILLLAHYSQGLRNLKLEMKHS